jgi:transglutaminase-like putative cysteine protease
LRFWNMCARSIRYTRTTSRDYDTWLFPDETLALKRGDCEDISFLIASLLIASGISPYTVRVAIGYLLRPKHRAHCTSIPG